MPRAVEKRLAGESAHQGPDEGCDGAGPAPGGVSRRRCPGCDGAPELPQRLRRGRSPRRDRDREEGRYLRRVQHGGDRATHLGGESAERGQADLHVPERSRQPLPVSVSPQQGSRPGLGKDERAQMDHPSAVGDLRARGSIRERPRPPDQADPADFSVARRRQGALSADCGGRRRARRAPLAREKGNGQPELRPRRRGAAHPARDDRADSHCHEHRQEARAGADKDAPSARRAWHSASSRIRR